MDDDPPDTRLFVSGLPPNFTDRDLGKHFAGRYQITDAQVIPGRRIGFVGFRNYTLARNALAYFDKSYIRMSKIHVEIAKPAQHLSNSYLQDTSPASKVSKTSQSAISSFGRSVPAISTSEPNLADNPGTAPATFKPHVPLIKSIPPNRNSDSINEVADRGGAEQFEESVTEAGPARANLSSNREEQFALGKRKRQRAEKEGQDEYSSRKGSKKTTDRNREHVSGGEPTRALDDGANTEKQPNRRRRKSADESLLQPSEQDSNIVRDAREKDGRKRKKIGKIGNAVSVKDRKGGVETPHEQMPVANDQDADENQLDKPTDDDWLRSKTSRLLGLDEAEDLKVISHEPPINSDRAVDAYNQVEILTGAEVGSLGPTTDTAKFTRRLFLRNLPFDVTESEIQNAFSKYGVLEEIHLVHKTGTNTSKGLAYVEFRDVTSAKVAMESMDGNPFQGRLLHVIPASEKRQHVLDDFALSKLPPKKQKLLKRKSELNGLKSSWNFLYMDPNLILSSIAERLGASKSDILDPTSSDAAVKQALAETHVIQENQAYFAAHGVNLKSFDKGEKGGKSLLVKNFPHGTTTEDLRSLFEDCGKIEKILMPPSGTIAIAQFLDRSQAQRALKQFAYKNFRGSVLFLEQAPKDLFTAIEVVRERSHTNDVRDEAQMHTSLLNQQQTSTLFIRNLNFTTTGPDLVNMCGSLEGFLTAKVKTKPDPKRPGGILSMGYGFAEFDSLSRAEAALKALDGYKLDGHELIVRFAQRSLDATDERRDKNDAKLNQAPNTKIIIKNLPFEATKKDVRSLFGPYGQLRSVRVPKKFDRSTRGFAFADFISAKEAENARLALKDTHLLGRRLVLEFAASDEKDPEAEIQAIEKKVGEQTETINLRKAIGPGRKRFNLDGPDDIA